MAVALQLEVIMGCQKKNEEKFVQSGFAKVEYTVCTSRWICEKRGKF